MATISRRAFFRKTGTDAAVAAILAAGRIEIGRANPLGMPIGSQTYPHRQMIVDGKFPELLKMLKGIGVGSIELCSALGYKEFASLSDAKQVKRLIADAGLTCESAHFSMNELRTTHEQAVAWAKEIGITQMVTATLGMPPNRAPVDMDYVKKAADEYNRIAAASAKAGLQQGLHNETFEVSMVDGQRVYDLLFGLLDPALVKFQFQMSTITAGLVGAEYFAKYPGRFNSMHVQDIDMNAPLPPPPPDAAGRGGRGGRPQTSVGKGTIDWVATFTAAKKAGVKSYFVEQNWELTEQSVAYLKTLNVP